MRIHGLTLTLLLCACTVGEENAAQNAETNVAIVVDANGNTATNGATAPLQPGTPGAGAPEPSGSIALTAAPPRVAPSATMTLTLRNGSRGQIGYNLCTSRLETAAGRSVPSDRVCTMELRLLEPGRNAPYAYELPSRLEPGRYRLMTSVDAPGQNVDRVIASNSFEVR